MKIHTEDLKGEFLLDEQTLINQGGEGEIYRLTNQNLAKIYHDDQLVRKRQNKVLDFCAKYNHYNEILGEESFAFPQSPAIRVDNDELIGFKMFDMGVHPQFDEIAFDPDLRDYTGYNVNKLDDRLAIELIYKLYASLDRLHQARIIIGDLNPSNILYDFNNKKVVFIDLDASTIGNYECVAFTPEYLDPLIEQTGKTPDGNYRFTVGSDYYALAIICYELFVGMHPFTFKTRPANSPNQMKNMQISLIGHMEDPSGHLSNKGITFMDSESNYEDVARLKTLKKLDSYIYEHFLKLFTTNDRDSLLSRLPVTDSRNPARTFHQKGNFKTIGEILKGHQVSKDLKIDSKNIPKTNILSVEDVMSIMKETSLSLRLREAEKTEDPEAFKLFINNMGFDYVQIINQGITS